MFPIIPSLTCPVLPSVRNSSRIIREQPRTRFHCIAEPDTKMADEAHTAAFIKDLGILKLERLGNSGIPLIKVL